MFLGVLVSVSVCHYTDGKKGLGIFFFEILFFLLGVYFEIFFFSLLVR